VRPPASQIPDFNQIVSYSLVKHVPPSSPHASHCHANIDQKRFASSSSCCFLVAAYQWETSLMLQDVHFHIDVIDVPRTSDRHLPPGPGRHHLAEEKRFFCISLKSPGMLLLQDLICLLSFSLSS